MQQQLSYSRSQHNDLLGLWTCFGRHIINDSRTREAMQNTIAKIPSDVVGIGFMHTLQAEVYAKHVGDSASTYWVVNGDNLQN
ncbi:hypothetical protein Tco_1451032 [Tanacetum coccineum]